MKCRICRNGDLRRFLTLGKTPLANSFLSNPDQDERSFPLKVCFCTNCKLVQLNYVVSPEVMFRDYVYVTSTSNTFKLHFTKMAEDISRDFQLNETSVVVDIGSNDGLLLKGFQKFAKAKVIGIEPATNIAKMAQENGVETINEFFNQKTVQKILDKKGKADVVTANNVFAHIDDIHEVIKNVKSLLKEDGIFVIEVQYLVDTIENMTFDNIYHEHLSYYTLTSLTKFFKIVGMDIFNVMKVDSHGGSLRVFIKNADGKHEINESVNKLLEYEKKIGVEHLKLYEKFAAKVYKSRERLLYYIKNIKKKGKTIVGYGAPAKSTTLLNFCGIGNDVIDYIVDDSPLKEGLYTPGTRIPVVNSTMLDEKKPDYILILAWNFADEILNKTKKYADQGVKFIVPLPKPRIV